jgi:hypothetical protein
VAAVDERIGGDPDASLVVVRDAEHGRPVGIDGFDDPPFCWLHLVPENLCHLVFGEVDPAEPLEEVVYLGVQVQIGEAVRVERLRQVFQPQRHHR